MTDLIPIRNRWIFLAQWAGLNLLGWVVGVVLVSVILDCFLAGLGTIDPRDLTRELRNTLAVVSGANFLHGIRGAILGASIGIFQWLILRKFDINVFMWTSMTALGYCIGAIILSLRLAMPEMFRVLELIIIAAIIGIFQSVIIRKYRLWPVLWWIGTYILGASLLLSILFLGDALFPPGFRTHIKKILVVLLSEKLFLPIYYRLLADAWLLNLALISAILVIATLTGMVLLNQSKPDSVAKQIG